MVITHAREIYKLYRKPIIFVILGVWLKMHNFWLTNHFIDGFTSLDTFVVVVKHCTEVSE